MTPSTYTAWVQWLTSQQMCSRQLTSISLHAIACIVWWSVVMVMEVVVMVAMVLGIHDKYQMNRRSYHSSVGYTTTLVRSMWCWHIRSRWCFPIRNIWEIHFVGIDRSICVYRPIQRTFQAQPQSHCVDDSAGDDWIVWSTMQQVVFSFSFCFSHHKIRSARALCT